MFSIPFGAGVATTRVVLALLELQLFCVARAVARATSIEFSTDPEPRMALATAVTEDIRILDSHRRQLREVASAVTGMSVVVEIRTLDFVDGDRAFAGTFGFPAFIPECVAGRSVWAQGKDGGVVAVPPGDPDLDDPFSLLRTVAQPYEELFDELITDGACECLRCEMVPAAPRILIISGSQTYHGDPSPMATDLQPLLAAEHRWRSVNMSDLVAAGKSIGAALDNGAQQFDPNVVVIVRGGSLERRDVELFRHEVRGALLEQVARGVEVHIALGHGNARVQLPSVHEYVTPSVLGDRLTRRLGLLPRRGRIAAPMALRRRHLA